MNIFAAIKKAINSDLDKPLNITLNEIRDSVNNGHKITRHVETVVGIPYNATYNSQVINASDEPVFSIEGSGRILQILPVCNQNINSRAGTVLLTVDGETLLNNNARYSYSASDTNGIVIVNDTYNPTTISIVSTAFGASNTYYFGYSTILRNDSSAFDTHYSSIITPIGIPFKNKFDIKLTQAISTDVAKVGVIVIYELYE